MSTQAEEAVAFAQLPSSPGADLGGAVAPAPAAAAVAAHLRGLPQWALLAIIAAAFAIGIVSVGLSWYEAHAARQQLAFGLADLRVLGAISELAPESSNEALTVHALNTMVHLKGVTNYQALGVLAIGAGAAFVAIGFALFLIGADGAFKLQVDGRGDVKLGLYATAPGLLCFVLAAGLIALGATRKHEIELGGYEASRDVRNDRLGTAGNGGPRVAAQPSPTQEAGSPSLASATATASPAILASICLDRVLPSDFARLGYGTDASRIAVHAGRSRAISPIGKAWMNGSVIQVSFLDGDAAAQDFVRKIAVEWTAHANLIFKFVLHPTPSDIRISFAGPGRWSYVGNDARRVPGAEPTMNLGNFGGPPFSPELKGVVLHMFGHALGLGHEHVAPRGGLGWDEAAVLDLYAGPPNFWTAEQTKALVRHRYSVNQTEGTSPDPDSVMRPPIPLALAALSQATNWNFELSALDKERISSAQWYPAHRPASAPR